MDIVKKINILIALMIVGFVGFVLSESFAKREPKDDAKSYLQKSKKKTEEEAVIASLFATLDGSPVIHGAMPKVPAPIKEMAAQNPGTLPNLFLAESGFYNGKNAAETRGLPISLIEDEGPLTLKYSKKRDFWSPPPQGFFAAVSLNYLIYRETRVVGEELKNILDGLYKGIVKNSVPFSVFVKFEKILLMLFNNKVSYRAYTARPEWSLAATDIDAGAIYVIEHSDFKGTVVHELTHIFYDGFFLPATAPLWLSEGFAVYMQVMAQSDNKNTWIVKNLDILRRGYYIDFEQFTNTKNLSGYEKEDIALWYAQAYSVVSFLIQKNSMDGFYQFSKNTKEGMPVGKALFRAYGMPFNSTNALEYAWQAYLQRTYPKGNTHEQ